VEQTRFDTTTAEAVTARIPSPVRGAAVEVQLADALDMLCGAVDALYRADWRTVDVAGLRRTLDRLAIEQRALGCLVLRIEDAR
jgi:hypothetical protein